MQIIQNTNIVLVKSKDMPPFFARTIGNSPLQKKKITHTEHEFRQEKEITLEKHFQDNIDLLSRNSAIIRALEDGYGQAEIARYLDVSAALISYVFRSLNEKSH